MNIATKPLTDAEQEEKKAAQEALWKDRDVLMKEYERLCDDIRSIEAMNNRVVGLGLTVVGTGFTYALKENQEASFIYLPILLFGVFFFAALQYYDVYWMGGYKLSIENRINELSKKILLQWELLIETKRQRANLNSIALMIVYFTILALGVGTSVYRVYMHYGAVAGVSHASLMAAFTVILVLAGTRMMAAYPAALRESEALFTRVPGDSILPRQAPTTS